MTRRDETTLAVGIVGELDTSATAAVFSALLAKPLSSCCGCAPVVVVGSLLAASALDLFGVGAVDDDDEGVTMARVARARLIWVALVGLQTTSLS